MLHNSIDFKWTNNLMKIKKLKYPLHVTIVWL